MNAFFRKLRWLLERRSKEDELRDELQFHLDEESERRRDEGLSEADARRAARIELGNVTLVREDTRAAWGWTWFEQAGQDTRYALRTIMANKRFAGLAVLSLTVGIGANTAIFSLWNSVLHSSLPVVHEPEQLVMLTNPDASGVWIGNWDNRIDGPRAWLTFEEFQQLRDQAKSFSGVMASQSSLDDWQLRFENGELEEARGRLVSGNFFEVLGVRPILGRGFSEADDAGNAPYAVISHNYWTRRFAARPDILGKTLTIHKTALTIIGVAPAGFIGETSAQQPDLWIPLRMQPYVIPDENWLRDTPPDKAMWLHVFARLKPEITLPQAEAEANAIFKTGLESFYGAMTEERKRDLVDQRLAIQLAQRGASSVRNEISGSLNVLLAGVGVLLMIACANLANLMLARGSARRTEIALRLSLGASRGRVIRQFTTETLALSVAGGIGGLLTAYLAHAALVRMITESNRNFQVTFAADLVVLGFTFLVTLAAAGIFGLLPAWQVTKMDAGIALKEHSRTASGTIARMLLRRILVGLQIALSLPLLVGAGLLARTVYNLQSLDLGFAAEGLLIARTDTGSLGYDAARRDALFRELRGRLERIPGVERASTSHNGVLSGGRTSWGTEVEGYVPTSAEDGGASVDIVGADYFSVLGVPIVAGRGILDSDHAGALKICVINEAFAKRFFDGRNPIGMRVTSLSDDSRTAYEVVGVARDARLESLRGNVQPRYFVPATQVETSRPPVLLIRANNEIASIQTVRRAIHEIDPALPIVWARSMDEQMAPWTAQERVTAQLATAFGGVALALAAIGLYGVISYGVARRKGEIAIRMALGARAGTVVAMILRETLRVVMTGLAAGAALSYAGSGLVANQLFGVAPEDPLTLALSIAVLVVVALSASYLPAHRASRLDPMTALRQE